MGRIPQDAADARRKLRYWERFYGRPQECLPLTRFELDAFRRHVAPERGQVAIDVGCGRGTLAAAMARTGMTVTGYDWSRAAVTVARDRHWSKRLGFAVHDFLTDDLPPGLEPGSVDVVACRLTMTYLEPGRFLEGVRHWLRPGSGCLYLVVQVTERQQSGHRLVGYPETVIEGIRAGWRDSTRWNLDPGGRVTALVLRGPLQPLTSSITSGGSR
ncbi:class I SAM-dependent methyltransferase [Streptomyces sp. NPDC048340]|uniref:class I SAM-dependent methyltransferase n=1 Tax=Streptomyces sp. NPDC048340 TaxID=3365537 RepID=UPI00371D1EFD